MHRYAFPILLLFLIPVAALSQTAAPTDSKTLQAILAEIRQLRHDLQTTNAMAARAQIALYRLQRQDEAVKRATQRLSDARSKVENLEAAKGDKAQEMRDAKAHAERSQDSNAQQGFEELRAS